MLLTWTETIDVYDDEAGTVSQLAIEQGIVVPDCCEDVRRSLAITLKYEYGALDASDTAIPVWMSDASLKFHYKIFPDHNVPKIHPRFCPYCGTKLPSIRRRMNPPPNIHRPRDGGRYCGTCDVRSHECICWYPEVVWETVPPEQTE